MSPWQSLLMRYGKTLLRSRYVQEFVNKSKRIVYSQQWQAQQAKLNSFAKRMTNAAASVINTSIGNNNDISNNNKKNSNNNNNSNNKQTPEFSSYQSLRLFVINNWYKHKSKIWAFLAANFLGILILCQVIWAVAEGMFRSEQPKIRESSPTQHAKSKEHTVITSSDNSNSKANDRKERGDKEEQNYYNNNNNNKVKVKSSSNVWCDYNDTVQDKYSMGISNNNSINDSFAMNANSASISTGVADRHELNNFLWNGEDKKEDKSKSMWSSWGSKKRDNNNDNSSTALDENVNEFDFTSQRQSTSSDNNLNNNQRQFAFVNNDNDNDHYHYASTESSKSSYLYDDTATRQQEVAKTKAKTRKEKRQSSDIPYHESSFNSHNIDNRYNNNTTTTTQHMFENTSAPFLVKMDNETEFTSFIDRDEMTGGVKHVN